MIDAHILTGPWTPKEMADEAIKSLEIAAENAPFPVAVHIVQGVEGHIGLGRKEGYSRGTYDYAMSLDDDDWLDPDIFQLLTSEQLDGNLVAAWIQEAMCLRGQSKPAGRYRVLAARKDLMAQVDWERYPVREANAKWNMLKSVGAPEQHLYFEMAYYYRRYRMDSAAKKLGAKLERQA